MLQTPVCASLSTWSIVLPRAWENHHARAYRKANQTCSVRDRVCLWGRHWGPASMTSPVDIWCGQRICGLVFPRELRQSYLPVRGESQSSCWPGGGSTLGTCSPLHTRILLRGEGCREPTMRGEKPELDLENFSQVLKSGETTPLSNRQFVVTPPALLLCAYSVESP